MANETLAFIQKASYLLFSAFFGGIAIVCLAVWGKNYWAERERNAESGLAAKKAEKRFSAERESWIGIISDLHDENEQKDAEIKRLKGRVSDLEKLLAAADRRTEAGK